MKYRQWKKNYKKKYGAVKCRRLETGCLPEKYNRRRISGHISQNQINPPGISLDTSLVSCGSVPCRDNPKSTQFTGMVGMLLG